MKQQYEARAMTQKNETTTLPCVILCGGNSVRFGADKATALLGSKPLLAHVIARISPQCAPIALNGVAKDIAASYTYTTLDDIAPNMGPLAGILAAMRWADNLGFTHVFTVSVDTPFIPDNWTEALMAADKSVIAIPVVDTIPHRVIALWPTNLHTFLFDFLMTKKQRKVGSFIDLNKTEYIAFQKQDGFDPFFNVNTQVDMKIAENILDKITL